MHICMRGCARIEPFMCLLGDTSLELIPRVTATAAESGKPRLNCRQSEGVTAILSRAGAIKGSLLFSSENAYQSETIHCACVHVKGHIWR